MPSYFFHLKFELYPTADPTASSSSSLPYEATTSSGRDNATSSSASSKPSAVTPSVWLPPKHYSIFGDLPSTRRHPAGALSPLPKRADPHAVRPDPVPASSSSSSSSRPAPSTPPGGGGGGGQGVIDCGSSAGKRSSAQGIDSGSGSSNNSIELLSVQQQRRFRARSFPPPSASVGIGPAQAVRDWRFGPVSVLSVDMAAQQQQQGEGSSGGGADGGGGARRRTTSRSVVENTAATGGAAQAVGPSLGSAGKATKARYIPLEPRKTDVGWGIVHLYREGDETPRLGLPPSESKAPAGRDGGDETAGSGAEAEHAEGEGDDDDGLGCTTLCIPAVPSYLSPSDFLGFVGEKWRDDVSHYRMVMTARMNRYLVLMKFRDGRRAREWRREFDGRVFNSMEAQTCQVVFVKSITFETPTRPDGSFPDLSHDPFTPSTLPLPSNSNSLKPFPPPTPNLIELPTCPVCLERMDDTTGLMTIPCQHVFHCSCLQKWKGFGCPVCRHTNPSIFDPYSSSASTNNPPNQASASSSSSSAQAAQTPGHHDATNPFAQPFGGSAVSNLCSVCDTPDDLWICLICGNVGCGRYKGGHAKQHWKETAHSFSLELETQHVWDYAGDMWVHRLIRDKGDGKVVELPATAAAAPNNNNNNNNAMAGSAAAARVADEEDVVPRAKLERIGFEYTHLLTSQLESQRVYFEELVHKAADKAASASAAAERALHRAEDAATEVAALRERQAALEGETLPALERDLARERAKGAKAAELARSLGKALQEERKLGEGLVERVGHVNGQLDELRARLEALRSENEELKETNRDLTMFISGQEKLKELESEGKIDQGEVEAGTVSLPEEKKGKGKGKGKGKR